MNPIPIAHCLECHARLSAIGSADPKRRDIKPGDVWLCTKCGGVMATGEDLKPRGFTGEELLALPASLLAQVSLLVRNVHFVRGKA